MGEKHSDNIAEGGGTEMLTKEPGYQIGLLVGRQCVNGGESCVANW